MYASACTSLTACLSLHRCPAISEQPWRRRRCPTCRLRRPRLLTEWRSVNAANTSHLQEIHFICKAQIAASVASRRGRDLSALQRAALSDSGNHFKPFNWSQVKSQTQWHRSPACRPLRGQTENPTGAPQCESTTNKERSSRRSGATPPRLLGNILAARGGQSVQTQTSGPTSATS